MEPAMIDKLNSLDTINLLVCHLYFSDILISEDIGVAKPNKEFFYAVFKRIGSIEINKVLLVGDSLTSDIQGANNIGIDCCWFNPKGAILDRKVKITYTITDLRQLIDIV